MLCTESCLLLFVFVPYHLNSVCACVCARVCMCVHESLCVHIFLTTSYFFVLLGFLLCFQFCLIQLQLLTHLCAKLKIFALFCKQFGGKHSPPFEYYPSQNMFVMLVLSLPPFITTVNNFYWHSVMCMIMFFYRLTAATSLSLVTLL